jgi:hypothetical protein
MNALLTAISLWLSASFGLPATAENPKVEFLPPVEITLLHYRAFTAEKRQAVLAEFQREMASDKRREVLAVYDDEKRTIFLPVGWSGKSAAELSVLVHEMVHHIQNLAGTKFACAQEREQLAYAAQQRWLGMFGRNLADEFEIDSITLLLSTRCGF